MDQPTGDAPQGEPQVEAAPQPRRAAPQGGDKNRMPLFLGLGAGALVLLGVGLYLETPRDVGKVEKLQVDESDLGKLRARTLREIGSFEAELSTMQDDTARTIRPLLAKARQAATSATSMRELEDARGIVQNVRTLASGQGRPP